MNTTTPFIDIMRRAVAESTSALLTAILTNELGGVPIGVTAISVTIYDKSTGTVLRGPISALNTNGGVYDVATGQFSFELTTADHEMEVAGNTSETRVAQLTWEWGTGKRGRHLVEWRVVDFLKVPTTP